MSFQRLVLANAPIRVTYIVPIPIGIFEELPQNLFEFLEAIKLGI